jgi:hypothetical protein
MAIPLVSLQYQEMQIMLELRSVRELFTINDTSLTKEQGFIQMPIQPNFNNDYHAMYRFLVQPPNFTLESSSYVNKNTLWESDIHLMTTYAFLTDEESKACAANEQRYLIKDIHETKHTNVTGSRRIRIDTSSLVSSWMWYFRRSDAYKRNEWSNYSNWEYQTKLPDNVIPAPDESAYVVNDIKVGPGIDFKISANGTIVSSSNGYFIAPKLSAKNPKQILLNLSILFDGKFREFSFNPGVYNYIEKYKNSNGFSDDGIYCYSFSLNTSPFELQPSGAINLSKFKTIEMDISTILPPIDPTASFQVICDTEGYVIGTTQKDVLYLYGYDFHLVEERYNLLRFISGNVGLLYTR